MHFGDRRGGGIYSIHLFVHRLGSPFCYNKCIEKGQPGKRVWPKGFIKRGHIFYTFCLIIDWVLSFCYKKCIERGQPGKRVWPKGGKGLVCRGGEAPYNQIPVRLFDNILKT